MNHKVYRVLVVDDDPAVRQVTFRNFTSYGFICAAAEDGQMAAEMLAANTYDAVVTDLSMPNRNGHSLVSELLEQPSRPVVVVVTGLVSPRIARDLVIRGIDRVDYKPVEHYKLASQVEAMIDRQRISNLSTEVSAADEEQCSPEADAVDQAGGQTRSQSTGTGLRRKRVLIVDDEPMIRELAERSFAASGYQCDTAADGRIAAEMFESDPYDMVVTDLRMPNRNGHSLATELLEHPSKPVVMVVTAVSEPRLAQDLENRGVASIQHKPIDHTELVEAAEALLSNDKNSSESDETGLQLNAPIKTYVQDTRLLDDDGVDFYLRCSTYDHAAEDLAEWIKARTHLRDAVLRKANATMSYRQIESVEEAIVRIGQKQVAELALTTPEGRNAIDSNAGGAGKRVNSLA